MSKIFKAKFFDEMKKSGLASKICPDVWKQAWVVNCQAVGTGAGSIKYLAPYVFKVAISNQRIVKVENRQVLFKYRKSGSNRLRTMSLEIMEFLRRFLQHVLLTGFMKVRYYGFMSPASRVSMQKVAACIAAGANQAVDCVKSTIKKPDLPACPLCGGQLVYLASIVPMRFPAHGPG
jgi:hypothetical protein